MKKKISLYIKYFTRGEWCLFLISVFSIIISFLIFDREGYMTLIASLIGVTSLIFNAKGNPIGQFLMVIFSVFYATISYTAAYYGEMITYLGMTAPMALFALFSWLKNPYNGKKNEVAVNDIKKREVLFMLILALFVTVIFYFILDFFGTANIILGTISVTTSFIAVYLTFRRSPYFAVGYAMNDIILIVLWVSASVSDFSYISVVVCFLAFLVNDLYGFINWRRMKKYQSYIINNEKII